MLAFLPCLLSLSAPPEHGAVAPAVAAAPKAPTVPAAPALPVMPHRAALPTLPGMPMVPMTPFMPFMPMLPMMRPMPPMLPFRPARPTDEKLSPTFPAAGGDIGNMFENFLAMFFMSPGATGMGLPLIPGMPMMSGLPGMAVRRMDGHFGPHHDAQVHDLRTRSYL